MSLITSVKPQKNKKRVNIYLDDKFGFGLDLETYVKAGLKVGQELSEKEIGNIVKEGELQNTYNKILMFASLRPRSEKEFKSWLRKYKVHLSIHDELFNRLKRLELLDDEKFAVWWVDQRSHFKPKPKRILSSELRLKGIKQELINEVLEDLVIDEKEIAKKLIQKNMRKWEKFEGIERRKKIYGYLSSKGIGLNTIRSVIGENFED